MADNTYDAIVIGSGMSGGWAAKELTEKGMETLVLEAGRSIVLHGRLTSQDHRQTIFNPRYELICEGAQSA